MGITLISNTSTNKDKTDLLVSGVEVPVTPQLLHHLLLLGAELSGVDLGELLKGETPLVESGSERYGSVVGVHLRKKKKKNTNRR